LVVPRNLDYKSFTLINTHIGDKISEAPFETSLIKKSQKLLAGCFDLKQMCPWQLDFAN